jgi:hypothetical protein
VGRHAIVEKLSSELTKGITSEAQVVYFLVEIRKLLEITDRADDYPTLLFHCEWALHSRMDRAGALRILQRFDELCDNLFRFDKTKLLDAKFNEELSNLLGGVRFRRELESFLEFVHITRDSFVLDWVSFMRLYGETIKDAPLVISSRRRAKRKPQQRIAIKHLKSVVVRTENSAGAFRLQWRLHYARKPPIDFAPTGLVTVFPIRDAGEPEPIRDNEWRLP